MISSTRACEITNQVAEQLRNKVDSILAVNGFNRIVVPDGQPMPWCQSEEDKPDCYEVLVRIKPIDIENLQNSLDLLEKTFYKKFIEKSNGRKTFYTRKWLDIIPARYDNEDRWGIVIYCLGSWGKDEPITTRTIGEGNSVAPGGIPS